MMAAAGPAAGDATAEHPAIRGGPVRSHQVGLIGAAAPLGGGAMVTLDVIPYCMAAGDRAAMQGLNVIGIKRRGFSTETIQALRAAYRTIFRSGLRLQDALDALRADAGDDPRIDHLIRFIE